MMMPIVLLNKYRVLPPQIKASCWFLICSFVQKGISVITTPIFTRLLTPAEYGTFSVFTSWLNIVTVFVTLNLFFEVYIQGLVKFDNMRQQYSSAMQGLCLTLVTVWAGIYFMFRDFWNCLFSMTTVQMVAMLIMAWTSSAFYFWAWEQKVDYKYTKLVAITLLVAVTQPALGVFLVIRAEDRVTARILGLAVVNLVVYTWLFFVQMLHGRKFFSWSVWRYAILFNLPLLPHYLSGSILNTADRIMIEKMIGASEAGIYSIAYSVSLIMTMFNTSLLQTIEPWLYKKIKAREIGDISRVAYSSFIIIAGVNVALIACAPEVVAIFAPVEYYNAIWIIPPIAMSSYFMFSYTFFAVFEFYYEKTWLITIATMVGAVLKLVLNYLFIDICGYYAAGYTTLLCFIVYSAMHYIFMQNICRDYLGGEQAYNTRILVIITLFFMFLGFAILFTYKIPIVRYSIIAVLVMIVVVRRIYIIDMLKGLICIK